MVGALKERRRRMGPQFVFRSEKIAEIISCYVPKIQRLTTITPEITNFFSMTLPLTTKVVKL